MIVKATESASGLRRQPRRRTVTTASWPSARRTPTSADSQRRTFRSLSPACSRSPSRSMTRPLLFDEHGQHVPLPLAQLNVDARRVLARHPFDSRHIR